MKRFPQTSRETPFFKGIDVLTEHCEKLVLVREQTELWIKNWIKLVWNTLVITRTSFGVEHDNRKQRTIVSEWKLNMRIGRMKTRFYVSSKSNHWQNDAVPQRAYAPNQLRMWRSSQFLNWIDWITIIWMAFHWLFRYFWVRKLKRISIIGLKIACGAY